MLTRPKIDTLFLLWLMCWSTVSWANTSLTQDVMAYDFWSLGIAALAGMLGGVARTLLALMSKNQLVGNTKVLVLKDLGVSLVCGAIGYVVIQGWNEFAGNEPFGIALPLVAKDLRLLLLGVCGYAPRWAFNKVHSLADAAASRAQRSIQGTADPVVSDVAPLGEK